MTEPERGTDRAGRRAKRFLTPLQKYEILLQLVRQEITIGRGRRPLGGGPLDDHADPHGGQGGGAGRRWPSPGRACKARRDLELEAARAEAARLGEALKEMAVKLMLVEGKGRWG